MVKKGKNRSAAMKSVSDRLANLPRVRKANRRQKRKQAKKTVRSYGPIPSSFSVIAQVFKIFKHHYRTLAGIVVVYLVLNIIFASGLSNVSSAFDSIRTNLQLQGTKHFVDALGGFGSLVGSAGSSSSGTASILQTVLFFLESLVIIWALRHLLAGKTIRVKQTYYSSMAPLIPFLLVIFFIFLQLLPITLGSAVVTTVFSSLFTGVAAVVPIVTIIMLLSFWSIYMISGSIFAIYIVTLPEMEPRAALRSAKNLVKFRRWKIIRRLLFMPFFILLAIGIIIVPLILYADFLVTPVFYILSMLAILFFHTYLYSLYRGLLE